jgi:Fe2+ or Zn2+ uptake regulation protein
MENIDVNTDVRVLKQKMEAFLGRCRQKGLRITPQRTAIYEALLKTTEHPHAEKVCSQVRRILPNISMDTVCRALKTFTEAGEIFVVEGSGVPKRFDANLEKHSHFRCLKCNCILDVCGDWVDNFQVEKNFAAKHKITKKVVYLEGLCESCLGGSSFLPGSN